MKTKYFAKISAPTLSRTVRLVLPVLLFWWGFFGLVKGESPQLNDILQFAADSSADATPSVSPLQEAPVENARWGEEFAALATDELPDAQENLSVSCMAGLEAGLTLFREHPATAFWANEVERLIKKSLDAIQDAPETAETTLSQLAGLIIREDPLMVSLLMEETKTVATPLPHQGMTLWAASPAEKYGAASSEASDSPHMTRTLAQYRPEERLEMLKAFRYRLDRRVWLWSFSVQYYKAMRDHRLNPPRPLTHTEISELIEKTAEVRNYFGVQEVGRRWRESFEVDSLHESLTQLATLSKTSTRFRPVFSATGDTPLPMREITPEMLYEREMARTLDQINSICYKIRATSMSDEQRRIFSGPLLTEWQKLLTRHISDRGDPTELLRLFEQYEKTGGGDAGVEMARCAYRLKSSPSEVGRKLGGAATMVFDHPNIKVYVSELFLNRFLPIRDPEFDVVQETILNNPVAGRRRTDTQVRIKLLPDENRLRMNLVVQGNIVAATQSNVFPARLYSESQANYRGLKQIEWKDHGIVWSESQVTANNTSQLSGVQTDIDFVPIVGELAREVVRGQYQSRQEAIRQETKSKIIRETKRRIDTETQDRFLALNERLNQNFFGTLHTLGLELAMQNSRTTDDWLLASLRLSQPGSPGSHTVEPPTLSGAFADLKVHQSAINTSLTKLQLAGEDFTVSELIAHIAQTLKRPELAATPIEETGLLLTFAATDPISIAFHENQIQIRLAFESIALGDQSWDQVEAAISYRPLFDATGNAYLMRDGLISLDGPMSIRAQIPLRVIFAKAFPAKKSVPLKPKLFAEDERFAGLAIGLCRISEGWFAVSVIQPSAVQTATLLPVPVF